MIRKLKSCFRFCRKSPKPILFALASLSGASIVGAQVDLVVDDFEGGYDGQNVNDGYYTSPVPQWKYGVHSTSGAVITSDKETWDNNYLLFDGSVNTWSMTWVGRDSNEPLVIDPSKPFRIEFDLLNVTGDVDTSWFALYYLIDDRWTNMGIKAQTFTPGYGLQLRVRGDQMVEYRLVHKGEELAAVSGSHGTATIEPGIFGVDNDTPGRPVRIVLEVFQNDQKLIIDDEEVLDLEIDPHPQNELYAGNTYLQIWTSAGQRLAIDNILIQELEAQDPGPGGPVALGDVYWANTTMIRNSKSDGSDSQIVREDLGRAIGVALDSVNEKLYWTDGNDVLRSDLSGENEETIYFGSDPTQGIVVNPDAEKIYWAEYSTGLFMADLDGSNPNLILDLADYEVASGSAGVALDPVTKEVYWVEVTNGTLVRLQSDGTGAETVGTLQPDAYGIAVDAERERVYYTVFGTEGTLNQFDLNSGESTLIFEELGQPLGVALTSDGSGLFWAHRIDGEIFRVGIDEAGEFFGRERIRVGEQSPFYLALADTATGPDAPPVFAGFLNGDFEADPFDKDWSVNIGGGIRTVSGIAPNSDTAVFIKDDGASRLIQYFPQWTPLIQNSQVGASVAMPTHPDTGESRTEYMNPIGPKWQFGFYTAAGDPDGAANRSVNLLLGHLPPDGYTNNNMPTINFRIIGTGAVEAYNNTAPGGDGWKPVFPEGTFEPSDIVDGKFVDPNVYYIQIDGDYSSEDPYYIVSIGNRDDSDFFAVSDKIRAWQYEMPHPGSGIVMVHFHGFVNAPYIIDDLHLIEVDGSVPEGYEAWAEGYFDSSELADLEISGPNADPDGDGIPNWLEYAFGGNPQEADRSILPEIGSVEFEGETYLTITFNRPADIDLDYEVESSGDLENWNADAVLIEILENGDGSVTERHRDSEPIDQSARRFLRVHVENGSD